MCDMEENKNRDDMAEYMKISEMKVINEPGGLKTRDMEINSCLCSSKKRKFDDDSSKQRVNQCGAASDDVDFTENSMAPATSVKSVRFPASSGVVESGEVTNSILKSLDLKADEFKTDNSPASLNGGFSTRDTKSACKLCGVHSEEMESSSTTTTKKSSSPDTSNRKLSPVKIPEAEIEEFFSAAEKREEKRFAEKYNYDIVKDVPLQGRYQWVSLLKPT